MAKHRKTTLWMRATNTAWKRAAIVLGIVVGIPLLLYGIAEYNYQQRVGKLVIALNHVGQNELKSVGGVSLGTAGVDGECRRAIDAFFAIDTGPCPRAGTTWQVLVESGKEAAFLTNILSKEGYTVHVGSQSDYKPGYPLEAGGVRGGVGLNVEMIVNKATEPNQAAPTGKQWLQLGITAVESHR